MCHDDCFDGDPLMRGRGLIACAIGWLAGLMFVFGVATLVCALLAIGAALLMSVSVAILGHGPLVLAAVAMMLGGILCGGIAWAVGGNA